MKICSMEAEYFMRMDGWTDGRAQTAGSQTVGQTDRQTERQSGKDTVKQTVGHKARHSY